MSVFVPLLRAIAISALILATFISSHSVLAQSMGANQAAGNEAKNDFALGGVSMAGGAALMHHSCHTGASQMLCMIGAGLVTSGLSDVVTGLGRNGNIDQTTGGVNGGGNSGGNDPGNPNLPPWAQQYLNDANNSAAQTGKSLDQLAAGADGGGPNALSNLPPDLKVAVDKAIKDFKTKYSVVAIGTEDLGGRAAPSSVLDNGLNFGDLLSSLNDRRPSSMDGLQKSLDGDPIGVAGGNIFAQVTNRYQVKISTQIFLPPKKK